jgi:hypothetical protein
VLPHENRRYVKLALIALLAGLFMASPAQAEVVAGGVDRGILAVAADGTPYVAYTSGRVLYVSVRAPSGTWRQVRLGRLPGTGVALAGIRVSERPHRYVSVLVEDRNGRWIVLARASRLQTVARAAAGSSFGPAGLTLDAQQRPALAYAVQRQSGKTFLRLVTFERAAKPRTRPITQKGFPSSDFPPGAAPVLVRGRLHVVETYTSAAIDWYPKRGGGWEGQYLFASRLGTPQGRVGAVFLSSTLWSSWTQTYPLASPDDLVVLLTSSADTQETFTLTHGIFVSIAQGETAPEIAAYDWVQLADDWFVYAGLVISGPANAAWQLDGRLEGFAIASGGARQLLIARDGSLEWFRSASRLPGISVSAAPVDAAGRMSGQVAAATTGTVQIYREVPHAPRELAATASVAQDGTFEATGLDPNPQILYRAVYAEPSTGIPFGALPGVPVGASG